MAVDPLELDAILITHEHGDHIRGADVFSRQWNLPIYGTEGSLQRLAFEKCSSSLRMFEAGSELMFGNIKVKSVRVPHDAQDPTQFVFECEDRTFGILTDIGNVPDYVVDEYRRCNSIFVEANHDPGMLRNGTYPRSVKDRVGGDWGHLSNAQTEDFLSRVLRSKLQRVVIGHISERNNKQSLIEERLGGFDSSIEISYATQQSGTDWLSV